MTSTLLAKRTHLSCPAVYEHQVVRLSCTGRDGQPASIDLIRRDDGDHLVHPLPVGRLYVGIRAGRLTFATREGADPVALTLLGDEEAAGLVLGDRWPRSGAPRHRGRGMDALSKTAHAVGHALNPVGFPKAMRSSTQRNQAMATVISWCRREMPDIHVLYNAQHEADTAARGQRPAGSRKGLIGAPGWDEDDSDKPKE
jgi:hypothetical protein